MALGGGGWLFQNKKLPGAYINFVSKVRPTTDFADRGYGAMALELDWGPEGEVFKVEVDDFQKSSTKYFGYDYTSDKITGLRDLFKNLKTGYFYRLNNGAIKAACALATAKYGGVRGNDLTIAIQANIDDEDLYDVITYLTTDGAKTAVDKQTVASKAALTNNDYVTWKEDMTLAATAGTPLTGGSNGETISGLQYQEFLDKIEPYYFNTLGCLSTEATVQDLYIQFTKRMRDDVGAKFQTVVYGKENVDYEGVISIQNKVTDAGASLASLVYWLTGAEAACAVNASCTNKTYEGDFTVDTNYKQSELERAITAGMLIFHRVADAVDGDITGDVNILRDINTFTSFSKQKNEDFSSNQVIRVLDQIAIDVARLFNLTYLGKEPNDADGRIAFWGDLVAYHKEMQRVRAIQNFVPDDVPIPTQGESKEAVLSEYQVQPTMCMEKLYMTVVVA
ncbi:MAG TPA: phage tail sheath family protein [Selenomonadales bacterium]|nr:phage tail sheath family protein [Selenomonadales bacterium]